MEAEITSGGDVVVEGQHVGQLNGFRFSADPMAAGEEARTLNAAAQKALASEIEGRATRVSAAVDEAFVLANDGLIRWLGEPIGRISAGAHILEPHVRVIADEQLTGPALELVQRRLDLWLAQHVAKLLGPCKELETGENLDGIARGIAFQVGEALGVLERAKVADELKTLPQDARASLRKLGVRFGAYHLYLPALVKPAPRALAAQLWALKNAGTGEMKGLDDVPHLAASGRTSFVADAAVPRGFYRAAGFRVCGERAVRVDILERLADLIRPAIAYRPGTTAGDPPPGTADGDGFVVTVGMTSLAGCSAEAFGSVLKSLGYVLDRRPGPAITVALVPKAATVPVQPPAGESAGGENRADVAQDEPPAAAPDAPPPVTGEAPPDDLESRVSLARQNELIAAALEGGALDAIEPLISEAAEPPRSEPLPPPVELPADAPPAEQAAAAEPAPQREGQAASAPASFEEQVPEEQVPDAQVSVTEIEAVAAGEADPRLEGGAASEPPMENPPEHAPTDEAPAVDGAAVEAKADVVGADAVEVDAVEAKADSGGATADAEGAAADAPEIPLIEVWRPHRQNVHNRRPAADVRRGPRRPHGGQNAGQNGAFPRGPAAVTPSPAALEAAGQGGAVADGSHPGSSEADSTERPRPDGRGDGGRNRSRDGKRPGGGSPGRPGSGGERHAGGERPLGERQGPGGRPDSGRPGGGRPNGERSAGERNGGGRFGASRDGGRREASGRGEERRGPSFQTTEAPRPRERQPDPNSPFAKLAALKAQMEKEKS